MNDDEYSPSVICSILFKEKICVSDVRQVESKKSRVEEKDHVRMWVYWNGG